MLNTLSNGALKPEWHFVLKFSGIGNRSRGKLRQRYQYGIEGSLLLTKALMSSACLLTKTELTDVFVHPLLVPFPRWKKALQVTPHPFYPVAVNLHRDSCSIWNSKFWINPRDDQPVRSYVRLAMIYSCMPSHAAHLRQSIISSPAVRHDERPLLYMGSNKVKKGPPIPGKRPDGEPGKIDDIACLLLLLFLFIVIFAVLGMQRCGENSLYNRGKSFAKRKGGGEIEAVLKYYELAKDWLS